MQKLYIGDLIIWHKFVEPFICFKFSTFNRKCICTIFKNHNKELSNRLSSNYINEYENYEL